MQYPCVEAVGRPTSLEFAVLLMFPSVCVIYIDRLFIFASGCYLHFVAHEVILSKALTLQ